MSGPVTDRAPRGAWHGVPRSGAEARDLTREVLRGRSRELVDDCLLVVSELVANALRHAGGLTGFEVAAGPDGVVVTVQDASRRLPVALPGAGVPPRTEPGGHGWPMVCRLATSVVVTRSRSGGKSIRATMTQPA
ncbi:ATP-binding protein [Streptomyces alkaliterrae]|uniref:ATP-binding protein n=1 Tax=Streptomyces alkaliterrae TaxID=2213162 RepID=A0A5P0YS78_9ACTN|nr:ATP-binding protein [Streptomyces alkaliterrae]MBB1253322.1 ATP-binding protein [Streptomyces alkaliterrae]MBB1259273.1 ATP-binding protein [Streptomyces alkaliterrae]MQS02302.1 ATP-binding protein [Streptomyces alkaliterrae]